MGSINGDDNEEKENRRFILNGNDDVVSAGKEVDRKGDQTDSILLKTLDGRLIRSVQAPGKGKAVTHKVREIVCCIYNSVLTSDPRRPSTRINLYP